MIRILIADDHAIVRKGLKQIVTEELSMSVAGEAANAGELFHLLRQDTWDIIVLDINMPGMSGLEALKQIKIDFPKIPVLILSIYDEEHYGLRALRGGADGYLQKVSAPEELVKAIYKITSGGKYISPGLAEQLAFALDSNHTSLLHEKLSDREYQVLIQIAAGNSAEKIAGALSLSVSTVYSYRNRLLEKLNLKSNVELTKYTIENKLIEI